MAKKIVKAAVDLLGLPATDKVTGFKGIITSVCFDLYGCIQVALTPVVSEGDKKIEHGHWFDVHRCVVGPEGNRRMPVPDFDKHGDVPTTYNFGPSIKPDETALPPR